MVCVFYFFMGCVLIFVVIVGLYLVVIGVFGLGVVYFYFCGFCWIKNEGILFLEIVFLVYDYSDFEVFSELEDEFVICGSVQVFVVNWWIKMVLNFKCVFCLFN